MKRTTMVITVSVTLIALGLGVHAVSSGAADGSAPVALVFDDAAQQVTLTIPTPPCAPGQDGCKWVLFVNEPDLTGKPVVDSVTGTTGVLTVKYPPHFCGVLQADARTGPPYVQVYGLLHTVTSNDCTPPTTAPTTAPTTTPTTPSTPTTLTPSTGTTTSPAPPNVSAAAAASPTAGPVAANGAEPTGEPSGAPGTGAPAGGAATQLPFTGIDITPLWLLGLALVVTGLSLLVRRRRTTP